MYIFILFDEIKHYFDHKNRQIGGYWINFACTFISFKIIFVIPDL